MSWKKKAAELSADARFGENALRGTGVPGMAAAEANPFKKALGSFAARSGLRFEVEPYDEYPSFSPGSGKSFRWVSVVMFGSGSGLALRDCGPTEEDACRRLAETVAWRSGISLAEFLVREDVCGR